ncbi:unnamed protein product [Mytilus edulis]|uniref:Uncharacterized protein n=1 Tax=Mytilus edulis TaxID=6550 RepID=A0A8S3PPV8_MYTED|nr:unnamed protein product [Mytilus edulis]
MAQIMAQTCEFSCKEEATLYCKVFENESGYSQKKLETIDTEQSIQIQADCLSYVKKVEETVDDLHMIVDRHKLIPLTTASDFKDIENEDLGRKRVFFRRRHDETAIRLLKFENLLKETHDSTFLTEWKALQTDVQMNNEETDDPLVAPRRIESFNQKKLTKFVIDEIDEKFQMKMKEQEKAVVTLTEGIGALTLARELKEKKNELVEENSKLKTEIKERQVQEILKLLQGLNEKERMIKGFQDQNNKLTTEYKQREMKANSQLKEKEKRENVLLEENDKLKSKIKIDQEEYVTVDNC